MGKVLIIDGNVKKINLYLLLDELNYNLITRSYSGAMRVEYTRDFVKEYKPDVVILPKDIYNLGLKEHLKEKIEDIRIS